MTAFAAHARLQDAYIELKYGVQSKENAYAVRKQAIAAVNLFNAELADVYENGPRVHGAAQASRIDMLTKYRDLATAVIANCNKMAAKAA